MAAVRHAAIATPSHSSLEIGRAVKELPAERQGNQEGSTTMPPRVSNQGYLYLLLGIIFKVVLGATTATAQAVEQSVVNYTASTIDEYRQKWANIYGPLELAAGGTLAVTGGDITVTAVPFRVGADFSVFDHLKYIAISTQPFAVPRTGSLEFSAEIIAQTPGAEANGREIIGCYGPPLSYSDVTSPCSVPFRHTVREGQQAGVVLNMINFETGQLFDWFVSGTSVFALIERLPTTVTGSPGTPLNLAYTQIIKEQQVGAGTYKVAIRYTRGPGLSFVEYFLDDELFARVDNVGIPLDKQGVQYSGYAPSLGQGNHLKDRLNSFVIGHGLFSLLDAFPYQHPAAPELSVSIPISQRLFGQGAIGTWKNFKVTTTSQPSR